MHLKLLMHFYRVDISSTPFPPPFLLYKYRSYYILPESYSQRVFFIIILNFLLSWNFTTQLYSQTKRLYKLLKDYGCLSALCKSDVRCITHSNPILSFTQAVSQRQKKKKKSLQHTIKGSFNSSTHRIVKQLFSSFVTLTEKHTCVRSLSFFQSLLCIKRTSLDTTECLFLRQKPQLC